MINDIITEFSKYPIFLILVLLIPIGLIINKLTSNKK